MRTLLSAFLLILCLMGCRPTTDKTPGKASVNSSGNQQTTGNPSPVNGQTFLWEEQDISFTVPVNWRLDKTSAEYFQLKGPDDLYLSCSILRRDKDFPMEEQLKYEYDTEVEQGTPEKDVRYLELDGVKGIHSRSFVPVEGVPYSFLGWHTFRKHGGEVQLVDVSIGGPANIFKRAESELYRTLHSLRWVKR